MKKRFTPVILSCLLAFGALVGCGHKEEPAKHIHTMVETAAKAGTCVEVGNIRYWHCSGCDKYYSDEAGTTEITQAQTKTGYGDHQYAQVPEKAPTEEAEGWIAHLKCNLCGQLAKGDISNPQPCEQKDIIIEKLVFYTVSYVVDGNEISSERVLKNGSPANIPGPQSKSDAQYTYTWDGWYVGTEEFTTSAVITANTTVEGKFDKEPIVYHITFKQDGHEDVVEDFSVEDREVTEPALDPVQGYDVAWSSYDLDKYEDQVSTVVKTPKTDTAYKVKHYLPDLNGEYGDPFEVEDCAGTTGAKTAATAKTVVGFTAQEITQADILADGSTVVEVYYNRNAWSITPQNNGTSTEVTEGAPGTYTKFTRLVLRTNQWGIAWTHMTPNFTKDELANSKGIYLLARFSDQPTEGVNVMCSNNNHFAKGLAKNVWNTIHLGLDQIKADYQGKKDQTTVDEAYACMCDSAHDAFGFYFKGMSNIDVTVDIVDMQLDYYESDNFAYTVNTANDDQKKTATYLNDFNKGLYTGVPAPVEGAKGLIRIDVTTASWGGSDLRMNLCSLFSNEQLQNCYTIDLQVYVVGDENMTFNGFIVDPHYAQNQPVNQWVTLHIPYSEFRAQANVGDDAGFFNNIKGGWIRTTKFQFKRSGSGLNQEAVVFYIGGVSLTNKLNTLVQTANYTSISKVDYVSTKGAEDPEIPQGALGMLKVTAATNAYGVSDLRINPKQFFTADQMVHSSYIKLHMYVVGGSSDSITGIVANTNQYAQNLACGKWFDLSIPTQLFMSQKAADKTNDQFYQQMVDSWIALTQFLYKVNGSALKSGTFVYYISGISLESSVTTFNSDNVSKVYTGKSLGTPVNTNSSFINADNKGANDPAIPENMTGYVKVAAKTDQWGLTDFCFDKLVDKWNFVKGTKIKFKFYAAHDTADAQVALSLDNSHNYGTVNKGEWVDFEYSLSDISDRDTFYNNTYWVAALRIQFKSGGSPLASSNVTLYLASVEIY